MYTEVATKEGTLIIVPPLPKEALFRLPKYCPKPTKNNLATLYYFWNRELLRENRELRKEKQRLKDEKQRLEEENQKLKEENEELKLEKDKFLRMFFKLKRQKKTITKKLEPEPRLKESYIRPLPERIDEQKEAILKQCPHCNTKLSQRVDSYQRIIEDIPRAQENRVKVIQYTINRYYCKKCKKIISAKPIEVLPKSRLGINTLLYVLYSKYKLRLPQNLIKENLQIYFNLKVSDGQLSNLLDKGKKVFKPKWQEIIETIKNSKSVNTDETSWRINGENCWLWAFATNRATRYTISESRGKGVPKEVLGNNFQGTVISDFYPAYNQFKYKQRCWVHLLRKIRELTEQDPTEQRTKLNHQLNRIYQQILFFKTNNKETTPIQRTKKANLIKKQLIIISRIKTRDHNLQKLLNLINKHAGELVVCIKNPEVSPDNNLAERALRPAVVARKISGGSKSKKGALTHEVNLSVIETLRKEGKDLFSAMKQLVLNYITSNG